MIRVKAEALRYLGYRGQKPDEAAAELIDRGYDELRANAVPKSVHRIAEKSTVTELLRGESIAKHLAGSDRVIFFAATLGAGADRLIRTAEIRDMAYALVLDALASAMTEEYCDSIEEELKAAYHGHFTWRFSPGYGDYPIDVQQELIRYLNAEKLIGLTVTESSILLPRKSVTAVIGISDAPQAKGVRGCTTCNLRETCQYRKDGTTCGNS